MNQDTESSMMNDPGEMVKMLMQKDKKNKKDKKGCSCKIGIAVAALVGMGVGYGAAMLTSDGSAKSQVVRSAAEKSQTAKGADVLKKLNGAEKAEAAKGIEAMKRLSDTFRATLIATRFGLMFVDGGTSGYTRDERYSAEERVMSYGVLRHAKFIDFDGKEKKFLDIINERNQRKEMTERWMVAMKAIGAATDEVVFAPYADEVKKLALLAVKYHMSSMPTELRAAWLAEKAGLFFTTQGDTCYTGRVSRERVPGTRVEMALREVTDKTMFADSLGRKLYFNDTIRKYASNQQATQAWKYASYCAAVVGADAVLASFANELQGMKKAAPKR